jgi:hypothetical protein
MIMNARRSQQVICGDATPRGRSRSRHLDLYTRVDFWRTEEKTRPELLPPGGGRLALGIRLMETRSRNKDDKLSIEPGQLHLDGDAYVRLVS